MTASKGVSKAQYPLRTASVPVRTALLPVRTAPVSLRSACLLLRAAPWLVLLSLAALYPPCHAQFLQAATIAQEKGVSGFEQLKHAIEEANKNAKDCKKSPKCLGSPVTLNLTQSILLTGSLPRLHAHAHLVIKGRCSDQPGALGTRKCVIDGQLKYAIFKSSHHSGAPSKLVLSNLIFQKAKKGVFVSLWSTIAATGVTFRFNVGGVEHGHVSQGEGLPPRFFYYCKFLHNTGSAIVAGVPQGRLSSSRVGYYVKRTVFSGNRGPANGGAVQLYGEGTSVFEDVEFSGNEAGESGGAIYADETRLVLRRVRFVKNKAERGGGAAVYGATGPHRQMAAAFCSCTFIGNEAPLNLKAETLSFSTPDLKAGASPYNLTFCNTFIPRGSQIAHEPYGFVADFPGSSCHRTHC